MRFIRFGLPLLLAACGQNGTPIDGGDAGVSDDSTPIASDGGADVDMSTTARDLTLRPRGMTAYQGRTMNVTVVESTGNNEMGFGTQAGIPGDTFDFRMPALVPEGDYHLDVFVDANGNGRYDGPSTDPSWRVAVPGQGSALVLMTGMDPTTDLASMAPTPREDVQVSLTGFTSDEQGQLFELRVIDPNSGATVGAYATPRLSGATLQLTLPGIVDAGNAYNVDFYSDVNADGVYTGPGPDHTWRVMVTADANGATVQWTHSADYTELDWR